jgi:IS66 C-terminal element
MRTAASRSTTTGRSRRYDRSCWAARTGCLLAVKPRTAILCSLVQNCKHLQINPFIYLRDVIERVSTHPARLVLELTPRHWKRG